MKPKKGTAEFYRHRYAEFLIAMVERFPERTEEFYDRIERALDVWLPAHRELMEILREPDFVLGLIAETNRLRVALEAAQTAQRHEVEGPTRAAEPLESTSGNHAVPEPLRGSGDSPTQSHTPTVTDPYVLAAANPPEKPIARCDAVLAPKAVEQ